MKDKHQRGARRDRNEHREARGFSERQFGRDEPWREERRDRYPDEAYGGPDFGREGYRRYEGGDRERWRGRSEDWRLRGDEGWQRGRTTGGYGSEFGSWQSGANVGFGPGEEPARATGEYGYGSAYGQGDLNSGRMGRGEFDDTDWAVNRPARGRGSWGGDWSTGRTGAGEYGSQYGGSYGFDQTSGRTGPGGSFREDYTGRGPKDYRRSDDRVREEICDRLTDAYDIDASEMTIKVEQGEVTLTGTVPSRDQKRRAEETAESVSGVRDVINQVRVSRGDVTASQQAPQQSGTRGQRSGVAADREKEGR